MKVVIDIPQEFEKYFNEDRFKDSLERIAADMHDCINETAQNVPTISGNYELELIDMFIPAFKNAEIRKVGHWIGEGRIDMCCSECGNTPDHEPGMTPKPSDFCPYCGSEME